MRYPPGVKVGKINGYGDCWYCNEVVVDPVTYRIEPDRDGPIIVAVCRKRRCREAADDGALTRE